MQRNKHLINRSTLLTIIVEAIETSYSEDISLLICYGSYVTGEYHETSDIDFFFVPKSKKGAELGHQFILNDIGYDLWPVSWERLNNLSNLDDQPVSILMDGEVLFASSEDDLRRLENLKNNLEQNLNDEAITRKKFTKYLEKAKVAYFNMLNREDNLFFIDAVNIIETLLIAIAILNGTYIKKGLKKIENELDRLDMIPAGFLNKYRKLIRTNDRARLQHIINEMIVETDNLLKSELDKENLNTSNLVGFYEEFKSTYNKLILACDESDYENAYYAGFMIDRETQSFLANYPGSGKFPNLMNVIIENDFDNIRANCLEHKQLLINLLNRNNIKINTYKDEDEFRKDFINKKS